MCKTLLNRYNKVAKTLTSKKASSQQITCFLYTFSNNSILNSTLEYLQLINKVNCPKE